MKEKIKQIEIIFICAVSLLFAFIPMCFSFDITLNWDASSTTGVTGYNLYRSFDSGSYSEENKISSVNHNTLEYTDTNLVEGTIYYYVITAVGEGNVESDYSDEIAVSPSDYGDINDDGKVTPGDALLVLKIYDQSVNASLSQEYSADMTHDGKITPMDALCVLKIFLKEEDPMCPE